MRSKFFRVSPHKFCGGLSTPASLVMEFHHTTSSFQQFSIVVAAFQFVQSIHSDVLNTHDG